MKRIQPLISVIVPCYKVEQYLPKCIDSILRQTYSNLEILLVDDGSPDRSGEICDAYAEKDERIIVIHKKNGGLSDARNVAINCAKGEWITFIDSDDYVEESYVETLYHLAEEFGCNCAVCCFRPFKGNTKHQVYNVHPQKSVFTPIKALEQMFYQELFDNNAHSKLYHRKLFESGIRYPEGLFFEDLATTYKLLLASNGVAYTDAQLYNYLLREGSIEGRHDPKKVEDGLKVLKSIDENVDMFHGIEDAYLCRIFSFMMHLWLPMHKDDRHYDDLVHCLRSIRSSVLFNSKARKKARAAALMSYFGFGFVRFVFSFVNQRKIV